MPLATAAEWPTLPQIEEWADVTVVPSSWVYDGQAVEAAVEARDESFEPVLRALGVPLLLGRHTECLLWTEEAFRDATAAFPDAQTVRTKEKSSVSGEFAAALQEFCLGLERA